MGTRPLAVIASCALFAGFAGAACGQVYECNIKGQAVFQQMPCPDKAHGKKLSVKLPPRSSDFTTWEWKLIGQSKVAVGMSEKAVVRSWGEPTEIHRSSYGPAQWVYRWNPRATSYVYVENGRVTNWQQ